MDAGQLTCAGAAGSLSWLRSAGRPLGLPPCEAAWRALLADAAVDGFAQEVRVTRMASRFLDEMQQNPAQ